MRHIAILLIIITLFSSCSNQESLPSTQALTLDTVDIASVKSLPPYRPTVEKKWGLIHTKLDLSFDFNQEEVNGEAELLLSPHFYDQNTLTLDAKYMSINGVKDTAGLIADFRYESNKLSIFFNDEVKAQDTISIQISYIAKPKTNQAKGGRAITSSKGIYFINSDGSERYKPTQIWTQGETDFSSCWFPTIDEPNQKTTQEIKLTVPEQYKTLSNGALEFSTLNGDGTRTDYWMQDKPHAPYLFMLAIGEFTITKDEWKDKEVSYYLEEEYREDARAIFGNTPEMIQFYSDLLGVEYPWDKYAQVVVRDFVSGAMENTSATLHGEFVQNHKRELLDYNPDDIISHELFHQWFGDLVTCESWSNLPLNEAFATYGEYLWYDHKYGKDEAQHKLHKNLRSYLYESRFKQEDWVRFHYEEKDNMFDGHSYSKGARILHMLRDVVGDGAFFESLNLYLTRYAYQSAEMHQLRLCFEEVTGRDLNWFFNQWAFASGHPILEIEHVKDTVKGSYTLVVKQTQDLETTPVYKLPVKLLVYSNNDMRVVDFMIDSVYNEFNFKEDILWLNFDAEKVLLCEKKEQLNEDQLMNKFNMAVTVIDKYETLESIAALENRSSVSNEIIMSALGDPFWGVRVKALQIANLLTDEFVEQALGQIELLALSDQNPKVRLAAATALNKMGSKETQKQTYKVQLKDSSYAVLSNALTLLVGIDSAAACEAANSLQEETNSKVIYAMAFVYSKCGTSDMQSWYADMIHRVNGYGMISYLYHYDQYIRRLKDSDTNSEAIKLLNNKYNSASIMRVKLQCVKTMKAIYDYNAEQLNVDGNPNAETIKFQQEFLKASFDKIKTTESDKRLLEILPN